MLKATFLRPPMPRRAAVRLGVRCAAAQAGGPAFQLGFLRPGHAPAGRLAPTHLRRAGA
jgi:hypothetical protein